MGFRAGVRALTVALALLGAALAHTPAAGARARPIVYVVVLDGLDGDRIEQGKAPFISSLLAGDGANAAYFPNSSSVIPAETNPNHVAMMSGAYPGRSGIPANTFALYAPLAHEDSCTATGPLDPTALPTETGGESRECPRAELTFEAIGRQGNPDELATAAIFGKPKLGRIFAGANLDPARPDADYLWAPCASGPDDDAYCEQVPTNPVSGYALDDRTVMDRVLATIDQGVLGPGGLTRPDLTFVNLHQIDTAGHVTGAGDAYDLAIQQADAEVERLVETLKGRGEWRRTVLILVSDHSMDTTSSKVSLTAAFSEAGVPESEFLAINNEGSIDFVYLADRTDPARFELLARLRAIALERPGVAEVLYREPNPADGGKAQTAAAVHPGVAVARPALGRPVRDRRARGRLRRAVAGEQPAPRQPRSAADRRQLPRRHRRQRAGARADGARRGPGVEPGQRRYRADGHGPARAVRAAGLARGVPAQGFRPRRAEAHRAPPPADRRAARQAAAARARGRQLRRRGPRGRRLEAGRERA